MTRITVRFPREVRARMGKALERVRTLSGHPALSMNDWIISALDAAAKKQLKSRKKRVMPRQDYGSEILQ